MPPRGGNPLLEDDDLRHILSYVRTFKAPPEGAELEAEITEAVFFIDKSVIPPSRIGPSGVVDSELGIEAPPPSEAPHPSVDPDRPVNAHIFFAIYFCLTGLHGIHVVAGMVMLLSLMVFAMRGNYSSAYFTPVDLGGLYWHLVDLIWIYLFPLLYLIS